MQLVHFAAGAGQMYCGACARDIALLRGLMTRGHDVQIIPLYTPLRVDGDVPIRTDTVYLGGINAWLQQQFPLFRRTPTFLDRLLDNPALLRMVSRFAISTRPSQLGEMTVSVLAGRDGNQNKELDKLIEHLRAADPPDVFSITNSLLSGIAPELKRQFAKPVVCGLQGEDGFVQAMGEPHATRARDLMRSNAQSVDLFLAPSETYATVMSEFLDVPLDRIRVVRTGLPVDDLQRPGPRPRDPFVIGYLSVINEGKGLDLLVAAFRKLVAEGLDVRLRIAGQPLDKRYWAHIQRSLREPGLRDRVEVLGEIDLEAKIRFLHECSAFSVPSRITEARGVAVMEAMAAGVPVVVPDTGVYPELLSVAEGGLTFPAGDADALASALSRLARGPEHSDRLGLAGALGLTEHFGSERTTDALIAALGEVLAP